MPGPCAFCLTSPGKYQPLRSAYSGFRLNSAAICHAQGDCAMLRKVNAIAVAAVMAAGTGGALRAQAATAVAVPCSATALASAVASAVSGTTLSLAASCVYTLTAALPEVSQDLTITGNRAT